LRWRVVLEYHLAGKTALEISRLTGFSEQYVGVLLRRPEVIGWKQQLMQVTEQEFEALFVKVVSNLRTQLASNDISTQMEAQNQFLKASGRFSGKDKSNSVTNNVTAEEVVFQILNGDVSNE
jgi:hypothetical protein